MTKPTDTPGARVMSSAMQQFPAEMRLEIALDAAVLHDMVHAHHVPFSQHGAEDAVAALYVYLVERGWIPRMRGGKR